MIVQDPLSKYHKLGKYALIFSIIPGEFSEYAAERVIRRLLNRQSVQGFFRLLNDESVAASYPQYFGDDNFQINPEVIIDYAQIYTPSFIEEAKKDLDDEIRKDSESQKNYIEFLLQLSAFKREGKGDLNSVLNRSRAEGCYPPIDFVKSVRGLVFVMACRKEWHSLLKALSEENKAFVWTQFMAAASRKPEDFNFAWSKQLFLSFGGTVGEEAITWFAGHYDLFRTGFSAFNLDALSGDFWSTSLLKGIYLSSHGRFKEGLKGVLSSLKEDQKFRRENVIYYKNPIFSRPYENVFLTVALFLDRGSASTIRKISSLAKKSNEFPENIASNLAALVFTFVDNPESVDSNSHRRMGSILEENDSDLAIFVLAVLCKIFSYPGYKRILEGHLAKRLKKENPPLKYVLQQALDAIAPEDPETKKLTEELGCPPLLSHYITLSEWQFGLDKLLSFSKTLKKPASKVSHSRIVYLVDFDTFEIQPYKQKSKDGITWSKGTPIAMSTFAEMLPEMDETDKIVAAKVIRVNSRVFRLGGVEVLYDLADTGKTFLMFEPEVPLEIHRDRVRIEVKKDGEGNYDTSTNIDFVESLKSDQHFTYKEDGSILTIYKITEKEHKIIELLKNLRKLPGEAKSKLSEILENISGEIPVSSELLKSSSGLEALKASSKITFQIIPDSSAAEFNVRAFVRPADGCELTVAPGEGLDTLAALVKRKPMRILRDLKAEKANWEVMNEKLEDFSAWQSSDRLWTLDTMKCLEFMESLRESSKIADIEWPEGARLTVKRAPIGFPDLRLKVNSVDRWFSLDGTVSIDGKTQLKINQILDKLKDRVGNFIHLEGSEYVLITNKLLKQLEILEDVSAKKKDELLISKFSGAALEALKENGSEVSGDKNFECLQERILKAQDTEFPVPAALEAHLRQYQTEGFEWLSRLCAWGAGGILADDMGLGKTVQAIAVMLARKASGPSLLVVPTAVLYNWKSEMVRFAPSLRFADFNGGNREEILKNLKDYDVVLCTYGVLNTEIESLSKVAWNLAVLDEAHAIKNKATQTSHSVMKINAQGRILLSGTPIQNDLSEIWNLFEFANPGYLGSYQQFGERFILPIEKKKDKEKQHLLKQLISPFILRRTKAEVLDELPEKTELIVPVELSEEELAIYENIRTRTLSGLQSEKVNPIEALMALTKLRQAACSPELIDKHLTIPSSKIRVFLELVRELKENKHRALVFSQFTSFLALVRQALDKTGIEYLYLDGSVPAAQRKKLVESYQNGDMPLFLISLKAGGTGLNLTAADYVIHLDPWWNPAVEDQASDRAYRIGQKRPVTIYKLISEKTVEQKILELHKTKKNLADALLEGSDVAKKLSKEEILELLQLS